MHITAPLITIIEWQHLTHFVVLIICARTNACKATVATADTRATAIGHTFEIFGYLMLSHELVSLLAKDES